MGKVEETQGTFEFISDIKSGLEAIWGAIKTVFHAPGMLGKTITETIHNVIPWDPKTNATVAIIVAIICTALLYKHWSKVTGFFGQACEAIPIVGKLLAIIIPLYMHYILFRSCWGVTGSGWIACIVFFALILGIMAPQYLKMFKDKVITAGEKGLFALSFVKRIFTWLGFRFFSALGTSDPRKPAIKDALESLHIECSKGGAFNDERFVCIANEVMQQLIDEAPSDAEKLNLEFKNFMMKHGVRVLHLRPASKAAMRSLRFAADRKE